MLDCAYHIRGAQLTKIGLFRYFFLIPSWCSSFFLILWVTSPSFSFAPLCSYFPRMPSFLHNLFSPWAVLLPLPPLSSSLCATLALWLFLIFKFTDSIDRIVEKEWQYRSKIIIFSFHSRFSSTAYAPTCFNSSQDCPNKKKTAIYWINNNIWYI